MFINNLETGLKREMGAYFDSDYTFNEARENTRIQAYFTERAPNMGELVS